MSIFVKGQRWASDTESDQGIGAITNVSNRTITIYFPATQETRTYSSVNSPLTRVAFNFGDMIESYEGWKGTVVDVEEQNGLYIYTVTKDNNERCKLHEYNLANNLKFKSPLELLLTGSIDKFKLFELKYKTFIYYNKLQQGKFRGFLGARTGLLTHQLNVAMNVSKRYAPRVMLADEVGLGKTIEAGLILHQQLITERAKRVLIVVPSSLLHQWIVEMLRKFNLAFKLFDKSRCLNTEGENPFYTEQLIICTMDFICDPEYQQNLADADFDMLVVDEAHYLIYEDKPNDYFKAIETISNNIPGLLLLTATPDQNGHKSHFERLRLLDKNRFYDFNEYLQEEKNYTKIANIVKPVRDDSLFCDETISQLIAFLGAEYQECIANFNSVIDADEKEALRFKLLQAMLDRHGTGRVFYRNTRESIGGFPKRILQSYPQKIPELYELALRKADNIKQALYPENAYIEQIENLIPEEAIPWWQVDPRIAWVIETLKANRKKRFLIICANSSTVIAIENSLRIIAGISASIFHQDMSIIDRDRAAAWFVEDGGTQVLICSEIGSEGRNFQFVHDLILFDLPIIPDQLEQRIGRLDRIGQTRDITIHVPYIKDTAQEIIFKWYDTGLNAFTRVATTAMMVYKKQQHKLEQFLLQNNNTELDQLITEASTLSATFKKNLTQDRDILLEINSKGINKDHDMGKEAKKPEDTETLKQYAERLFDSMEIEFEDHSKDCYIIKTTNKVAMLGALSSDYMTLTTDRDIALSRDDMAFLSWEHPLIHEGMERIMSEKAGSTSVALLPDTKLPAGTLLVEAIFILEVIADKKLQLDRYLPPTPIRCLIDPKYKNLDKITFDSLQKQLKPAEKNIAKKLVRASADRISSMASHAEKFASITSQEIIKKTCLYFNSDTDSELLRLQKLKQINPNVRDAEIDYLKAKIKDGLIAINKSRLKLNSIRVIFTV